MPSQTSISGERVRVLVAESTQMSSELLADALEHSSQLDVFATANSSQIIDEVVHYQPDVMLISARMGDDPGGGIPLIPQVRAVWAKVRVIVLLDKSDRDLVVKLFRAGAQGVFSRTDSPRMIVKAILKVHFGQIWVNSTQVEMLISALSELVPVHAFNVNGHRILTNREEQIVSLVATGLTNREIARELDLSDHTVKNYLFQIYEKLGISNRVELALYSRHSAELRDETAGPSDRPAASSSSSSTPEDRVVSLLKAGSA